MANDPIHNKAPPAKLLRLLLNHQRWLNSNGKAGSRLEEESLQLENYDLDGIDFSKAYLSSANFVGGSVKGCRFWETDLTVAIFNGCDVTDADFTGARLHYTTFATNHERALLAGSDQLGIAWSLRDQDRAAAAWFEEIGRHSLAKKILKYSPYREPRKTKRRIPGDDVAPG